VWLAEFAPIAEPTLVPKMVATALGVPEQPGRELINTLVDALKRKALLLVLDNCEHLLAACRDLTATLLRNCPHVRILATSREELGVPGETLWRVPSLSIPEDILHLPPSEELAVYDAVRLFVDRAAATTPEFAVTSENAPAVAQVCQRLDGMPLAIELAAARVKVLTVEQIAARLDDRFLLLTGGSRTLLPRQQTLRATLDWSYDLLSDQEQTLFRRLSVFAGGWTLEAAETVCAEGGIEASEILDLLTQLVDKSLVIVEAHRAETRYRLLETVRQYGRDRLVEAGESDRLRSGHLDFFLQQAETQAEALRDFGSPALDVSRQRMEKEYDNIRTALEWSWEKADKEATLRLVIALSPFWEMQGFWHEGRKWSALALTEATKMPSPLRAEALHVAGLMASYQGNFEYAITRLEESMALRRELGDQERLISSLNALGFAIYRQGDYRRAVALFEESLGLIRELGDKAPLSRRLSLRKRTTYFLGIIARASGRL
jgi:predicted ATPase